MKFATKIGLAAAAVALIAMLTAASASASALTETVLCKEHKDAPYCKSSDRYPKNTAISAAVGLATIESAVTVTCNESTISGTTSAEAGEPLPVSISAWSLGGCSRKTKTGSQACTTTAIESAPYSGSLNRTSGSSGTMSVKSGGKGSPGWTVKCGIFLNCTLTLEPGFTYKGLPGHAEIVAEKLPLTATGGTVCPATATFTGTYIVNSPAPARLAIPKEAPTEPATALCKGTDDGSLYCESGNLYPSGTILEGEASNVVFNGSGSSDLSCGSSSISAETTANYGVGSLPVQFNSIQFSNCSIPGVGSCEMSVGGFPEGKISRENGDGLWSSSWLQFTATCGSSWCVYYLESGETIALQHGEPGAIDWNEVFLKRLGGEACSEYATLEGNYPLSSPSGPLIVTDALR